MREWDLVASLYFRRERWIVFPGSEQPDETEEEAMDSKWMPWERVFSEVVIEGMDGEELMGQGTGRKRAHEGTARVVLPGKILSVSPPSVALVSMVPKLTPCFYHVQVLPPPAHPRVPFRPTRLVLLPSPLLSVQSALALPAQLHYPLRRRRDHLGPFSLPSSSTPLPCRRHQSCWPTRHHQLARIKLSGPLPLRGRRARSKGSWLAKSSGTEPGLSEHAGPCCSWRRRGSGRDELGWCEPGAGAWTGEGRPVGEGNADEGRGAGEELGRDGEGSGGL